MKHINVLVLVSIILLCSCSQAPITRTLHRAEQLMTEAPDSAEKILNAIPRQNLKSRAHKARFALLYSQAMDKCYIDTDNDSLISVAVNYYSKRGSDHEKALAYYYESVVYRNAKNTDAQVESLVKAQQYAEKTTDHFLNGLIYSKLGQIYYAQYQISEAEELFRKLDCSAGGLTTAEAKSRLEKNGYNELISGERESVLKIFLSQFADFLVIILILAATISAVLGDLESTIVILAVITMNAVLGTVQTV